ncbi:hypothetical protein C7974DRAFT_438571 [Boeremia exigua]|uniref:uncharacterized protein n=1 Tax=Boeremia exigua TaxID=749465 RepID=UPI001E8D2B8A|nr:uncharacterized protein C7974DRAFT_438571 [Boeremia exigua]KAH6643628.1 hypothetical protein C7974DRAFT_438571 [Boeremia exigua]
MKPFTQFDPEWINMQQQHEAERRHFQRRIEAEKVALIAKQVKEDGDYWGRYAQKLATAPGPVASKAQLETTKSGAAPTCAASKVTLPQPDLSTTKRALPNTCDSQKQGRKAGMIATAAPQQAGQAPKQSRQSQRTQQPTEQAAMSSRGAPRPTPKQIKPKAAALQSKSVSGENEEVIDLCSSDDDMLVEVSKAAYEKKATARTLDIPGVPSATSKLFGRNNHNPSVSPLSSFPQCLFLILAANSRSIVHKAGEAKGSDATTLSSACPRQHRQSESRLCATSAQYGATTSSSSQQSQPASQAALGAVPPRVQTNATLISTLRAQETGKLFADNVTNLVNSHLSPSQQKQRIYGSTTRALGNARIEPLASDTSSVPKKKIYDEDVHVEDVPTALLRSNVTINRLHTPVCNNNGLDTKTSPLEAGRHSIFNKNPEKTHLPSPSPSLASAPHTPVEDEAESLLNMFKKPQPPLTSRHPSNSIARSRASSHTLAETPNPGQASTIRRQASVASKTSIVSTSSRKRKQVDLSDEEQSNYAPSEAPTSAACSKPTITLGPPHKKPSVPIKSKVGSKHGPVSELPSSSGRKKTSTFGSRSKAISAFNDTPVTPPRSSTTTSTPKTPVTPIRSKKDAHENPFETTPSKRKAAIRAESKIQKIRQADELFHTEEEILQATAKEHRRNAAGTDQLHTRMRSMSITAVPIGPPFDTPGAAAVSDKSARADDTFVVSKKKDGLDPKKKLLKGKATEGRRATRNIDEVIGDGSDEDADYLEDLRSGSGGEDVDDVG